MERVTKSVGLLLAGGMMASLLNACNGGSQLPEIGSGVWRVGIELPGGELPVTLEMVAGADGMQASFINGRERVGVPVVNYSPERVELDFPAFNNRMVLSLDGGEVTGQLDLTKRGYRQHMPVTAQSDLEYRFLEATDPQIEVTGRWEVVFVDEEGNETPAIAEFDQQDGIIHGTFLTPTGDYRYLAGNVHGNELRLSTFDGAHAFLFSATMLADGSLSGDFWSGTRWHETWTASRNFDARLPDAFEATKLAGEEPRIRFSFPDLDGNPVSLDDPQFRNKVVLVTLAGTWCPNCADEAEFLGPYYRANKDRGLAVIGLLFEHFDDFETAARQGKRWREKHGIEFDLLIAGVSDKAEASRQLPFLDRVRAYPTMLFIGRDGTVRKIHTGFAGPGTGEHYRRFQTEFNQLMGQLLNEAG